MKSGIYNIIIPLIKWLLAKKKMLNFVLKINLCYPYLKQAQIQPYFLVNLTLQLQRQLYDIFFVAYSISNSVIMQINISHSVRQMFLG